MTADDGINSIQSNPPSIHDLDENAVDEKTEIQSSIQVGKEQDQKKCYDNICGGSTILTFVDNIRSIFSQGRSSRENSK